MKKSRDARMYVRDILESCDLIIGYIANKTLEEFRVDVFLQDAVIRRFEIIGEAAKRLPKAFTERYPDVAWQDAAGFRDVLIHDYPEVVVDSVFITAKDHLPELREQMQNMLYDLESGAK